MWGATVARSAALRGIAQAIRADSLVLEFRAQEVRGARPIHGASDASDARPGGATGKVDDELAPYDVAKIARLVRGASLCDECLGLKTGLLVRRIRDVLNQFAETIKFATTVARCDTCLKTTVVHRLG